MRFLSNVLFRLRTVLGWRRAHEELDEEMAFHVDRAVEKHRANGLSAEEARRAALREFGDVYRQKELARKSWGVGLVDNLRIDTLHTLRQIRRSPVFTAVAILTLALGIGGTTAIFSIINTLLIRSLPFSDPERLVWVANTGTEGGLSSVTSRTSNLRDYRRLNWSFEDITGYNAFFDWESYLLTGEGEPEHLLGVGVVQNFFEVLGIQPALGRTFTDEESLFNGPPAILLTDTFWRRRFGADPGVVGRSITINSAATAIVGVLPATFDFATIFAPGIRIDFLSPYPVCDETDNSGNTLAMIGRLKPGATIASAQADLDHINTQLQEAEPNRWGLGAAVTDLREQITSRFRRPLLVLAGAVGMVLLIACANLSNMLLARATARRREMAVRSALGASRTRLVGQVLTESLILSGCGAVVGIALAFFITRAVSGTQAISIPLLATVSVDTAALLFTVITAGMTALLFGLVPALQISAIHSHAVLQDSSRSTSIGRGRVWIREVLVVSEVALACLLLVGTGLLLRSFVTLLEVDLGFEPRNVTTWRIETNRRFSDTGERIAYLDELARSVAALPGVESVGLTDALPLGRNHAWGISAQGAVYADGEQPVAFPRVVDAGYLTTMRIPLIDGRDLTIHDMADDNRSLIVNKTLANALWPGEDPIDRIIVTWNGEWQVIGIAADVRHSSLEEGAGLEMYMPLWMLSPFTPPELVVRSDRPPESVAADIRAVLQRLDPTIPTRDHRTLEQIVDLAVSPRRFILLLVTAFGLMAMLLAALGIYGVVSYSVSRQAREIGIRMALGATALHVQFRVIRRTLLLVTTGICTGLIGGLVLSRFMTSMLYGIGATDPTTFVAMAGLLLVIAVAAGYLPARRAARIAPVSAMHEA